MKIFFRSLVVVIAMIGLMASTSYAGSVSAPQTAGFNYDIWSTPSEFGQAYFRANGSAIGEKEADADIDKGTSFVDIFPTNGGFINQPFAGGMKSESWAQTDGWSTVTGWAKGTDIKTGWGTKWDFISAAFKRDGIDSAAVNLEIGGSVNQINRTEANHGDSFAGGFNASQTSWSAFSSDYNNGTYDFNICWWSININAPYALVTDSLEGGGTAFGKTIAFAKQTDTKAIVASKTWNNGSAWTDGSNLSGIVEGMGTVYGIATLPGNGYASYNASFNYSGGLNATGMAKGVAVIEKTGTYGVTAYGSSTATVNTSGSYQE